ncbi:MAG: hypothetical protein ACR2NN_00900 [Bryobacteraceae bacterium]
MIFRLLVLGHSGGHPHDDPLAIRGIDPCAIHRPSGRNDGYVSNAGVGINGSGIPAVKPPPDS